MVQRFDDGVSKFEIDSVYPCERCKGTSPYAKYLMDGQIQFLCKRCDFPIRVTRKNVKMTWSANLMILVFIGGFIVIPILWLLGYW